MIFVFAFLAQQLAPVWSAPLVRLTHYDEQEARMLLNLAAGAYSNMPETCVNRTLPYEAHWNVYSEANTICDSHDSSCASYIVRSDIARQIVVVFRGTKTHTQLFIEGWESLQPGTDFFGAGKVNRYFFRALTTLWPHIEPLLKDPIFRSYPVTFTGHSLGGALASLAAARAALDGLRNGDEIKLITFGQPRVGDHEFAMKHDQMLPYSYRVVHRLDIVPHLPSCHKDKHDPATRNEDSKPCDATVNGRAYHHGVEIWYPYGMAEGAEYFECLGEPKDEDFGCSDSLSFEFSKYETYISDHRRYFEHSVPTYGKLGCVELPETDDEKRESAAELGVMPATLRNDSLFVKLSRGIGKVARFLGINH